MPSGDLVAPALGMQSRTASRSASEADGWCDEDDEQQMRHPFEIPYRQKKEDIVSPRSVSDLEKLLVCVTNMIGLTQCQLGVV